MKKKKRLFRKSLSSVGRPAYQLPEHFHVTQTEVIHDRASLARLDPGVLRAISDEFDAEMLLARLCLVLLSDHTVALFALAEHVSGDQADELLRRVVEKGYELACPARYVLDAPLLLSVAEPTGSADQLSGPTVVSRQSRTALTDAFQDLIEWGVQHHASDLHINIHTDRQESEIRYTIRGRYVAPERFRHMSTVMLADMLSVVWMDVRGGNGALFDPRTEQQGSLLRQVDGCDVVIRWASLAADTGPSVCLRILVRGVNVTGNDLSSLGYLPDQVATISRAMVAEGGAIVFAGTVGSGKSTSLATLMASLPADRKVITIEDPVEYSIPNAIQNTVVRTLHEAQPQAYAAKLRTLKRSAMTDVLLGEVRDHETGQAFMDLTSSGVNVYTTVHAGAAALVPDRLASDFIGVSQHFVQAPGMLRLIIFQTLVSRLCSQCSLPASSLLKGGATLDGRPWTGAQWAHWLEGIQQIYQVDTTPMRVRNPQGCASCGAGGIQALKGYAGRTVVAEIIEPALQPGFLHGVQNKSVGTWLAQQAQRLDDTGLQHNDAWHSAMDNGVRKALAAQIDPRDIERHFHSFETRMHQQRSMRQAAGTNLIPASSVSGQL